MDAETLKFSHIFRDLSEQTIFLIAHELVEEYKYSPGITVMPQSLRSIIIPNSKDRFKFDISNLAPPELPSRQKYKKRLSLIRRPTSLDFSLNRGASIIRKSPKGDDHQEKKEHEGIYIIKDGKCQIRNLQDKHALTTLITGDFFGESEFLEVIGFTYFGDIITVSDVDFWFIPASKMQRIPEYDQIKMKSNCVRENERIARLIHQCSIRYGINSYDMKY